MTRNFAGAALLALVAIAGAAQATYEENATACPEASMCAADSGPADRGAEGNASQVQPERGFGNGTGACGGADACPGTLNPCARMEPGRVCNFSGGAQGNGTGTCMDGQQGNETCDPDVQYFGGSPGAPGGGAPGPAAEQGPARAVPAAGAVLAVGALGVALLVASRRRV